MSEPKTVDPWDPHVAKEIAEEQLGSIECTSASSGMKEALADQGWRLNALTLWWEPGWSPNSHIAVLMAASWTQSGAPKPPSLKAVVYDSFGRLVSVEDISPFDQWSAGPRGRDIHVQEHLSLRGSGPATVPGRVIFQVGDEEYEDDQEWE